MKKLKDERLFFFIREFLTVYLPKQRVCSPNTIKSYKESLNLLFCFLQSEKSMSPFDVTFETLNSQMILDFLNWLEYARHCSVSTRNQRFSAIRAFFNYAAKMEITLVNCQNEIHKIPAKKNSESAHKVEFLSETALKTILSEPNTAKLKGIRDLFYMILLYDSGARNQELLDLKVKDVDATTKHAQINVMGKGRKPRSIPIMDKTASHCIKYLSLFHDSEKDKNQYLFYTIRHGQKQQMSDDNVARFIRLYAESAKLKCPEIPAKAHPHLFRHTRAMHLYRGGMPLALLAEWLGHAQLETTLIYAHADTEMKRRAIQKATAPSSPVNIEHEMIKTWKNDEDLLLRLYGLN
ncbi:MAG: site-specific integrase [Clostridiales bacterium]|nr:site-specific integrase [Clostridiales bacterium]